MCELEGSPKQVAWATEIRQEVIKKMQEYIRQYIAANKPGRAEVLSQGLPKLLSKKNQASWWIDRRYDKPAVWEATIERLVPAEEIYKKYGEVWIF